MEKSQVALRDDDLVITPGGSRRRNRVHLVTPGGRHTQHEGVQAGQPSTLSLRQSRRPGPPDQSNWITYAGWMNTTGQAITSLSTTWIVPSPPPIQANQLVYLFCGIEPQDGSLIVQPVLQWGDSGADSDGVNRTGSFWTVASWIVGPGEDASHTPHVQVNPGDQLVGLVTLVNQSADGFYYRCEFENIAGTDFITNSIPELSWCVETLEAYERFGNMVPPYDLLSGQEYPASNNTLFAQISVGIGAPVADGGWQAVDEVQQYNERTIVDVNSTQNGSLSVFYR